MKVVFVLPLGIAAVIPPSEKMKHEKGKALTHGNPFLFDSWGATKRLAQETARPDEGTGHVETILSGDGAKHGNEGRK